MPFTISGTSGLTFPDSSTMTTGQQACKAWVNFNGSTSGIRASFNVSSVTKNGSGDYTLNFTNAFVDANYSLVAGGMGYGSESTMVGIRTTSYTSDPVLQSTSQVRIGSWIDDGTAFDVSIVNAAVFR